MKYKKSSNKSFKQGYKSYNNLNLNVNFKRVFLIVGIVVVAAALIAAGVMLIPKGLNEKANNDGISHIVVSKTPVKLEYSIGDKPSYEGISIQVVQNSGKFYMVNDLSKLSFAGFDSSKSVEEQEITVSYNGFTGKFYVTIVEPPKPAVFLSSIKIDPAPDKVEYTLGDKLSVDGGVIVRYYSDDTLSRISLKGKYVDNFKEVMADAATKEPGTYTYDLTVEYTLDGITRTTTYEITIKVPVTETESETETTTETE